MAPLAHGLQVLPPAVFAVVVQVSNGQNYSIKSVPLPVFRKGLSMPAEASLPVEGSKAVGPPALPHALTLIPRPGHDFRADFLPVFRVIPVIDRHLP